MVRKLAGTLATLGMLTSPFALGLGLGKAELLSSLNQPLNATIQLAQTEGVSASEIRVRLAGEDAFAKAGLDRQFFLQNLSFNVRQGADGAFIELSSKTPIKEPFLNFLLEVEWPQGQLMREYTFLLDPPSYNTGNTALARNAQPSPALSAPAAGNLVDEGARRIKTTATDTLWSLARKNRPNNDITIKQAMLAIQEANPDAFPTANINNMETGSTLLIPSAKAMLKRSELDAIREVARQNQAWVALKKTPASPSAEKTTAVATPAGKPTAEQTDKLTLVSDAPAKTNTVPTATADLEKQVALKDESLDKSQRENAELSSRLDELQKQVGTLQKLIRLKDEQLAAMESMLAKQNELLAGKKPADNTEMKAEVEAEAPKAEAVMPAAPVAMVGAAAMGQPAAAGAISLDLAAEANKTAETETVEMKAEPAPVEAPAAPEPIKPFVIEKQEQEALDPSSFLVDTLKNNAAVIGGAAAAVLSLVLLLMVMRRRKAQKPKIAESGADVVGAGTAAAVGAGAAVAGAAAMSSLDDDLSLEGDLSDDLSLDDDLKLDDDDFGSELNDDDMALGDLSLDDLGGADTTDDFAGAELDNLEFDELDKSQMDEGAEALAFDESLSLDNEPEDDELAGDLDADFGDMDFELDDLGEADAVATTAEADQADSNSDDELGDLDLGDLDLGELDFDLDEEIDAASEEGDELKVPFAQAESMAADPLAEVADEVDLLAQDNLDTTETDFDLMTLEQDLPASAEVLDLDHMDSDLDDNEVDAIDLVDLDDALDLDDEVDLSDEIEAEAELLKQASDKSAVLEPLDFDFDDSDELVAQTESEAEALAEDPNAGLVSDAIAEAEQHLSEGEPVQAAAVLQRTLAEVPDSNELRLKFMETLVELKDEATFDHELRALQNSGDIDSLTTALALQSQLYSSVDAASVAETDAAEADDFEPLDLLELNADEVRPDADDDIDLNSELDALERDFGRYAESASAASDDLSDMVELVDLDLGDESELDDDEPMINLNPADLGEPDPLEADDFELTDLNFSDDEFDYELDNALNHELEKTQQDVKRDTEALLEDLGDLSMLSGGSGEAENFDAIEGLVGQDLQEDDLVDLSPSLDELDDLSDLGSLDDLADISMTEDDLLSDDSDSLNIDDILDENEDPEIKLDLARAYIDMGNNGSAIDALKEVIERGNSAQRMSAQKLMESLQS